MRAGLRNAGWTYWKCSPPEVFVEIALIPALERAPRHAELAWRRSHRQIRPLDQADDEAEEPTTTGEDAGMLLDSIIAAVPNGEDLHRLRVAAFENPDELSQVLTEYMDSPGPHPAE